jgi:hypothetical protein
VSNADKAEQWEAFRRVAGSTEDDLRFVKVAADPLRHGQPGTLSGKEREELFLRTWQVVDSYLARI